MRCLIAVEKSANIWEKDTKKKGEKQGNEQPLEMGNRCLQTSLQKSHTGLKLECRCSCPLQSQTPPVKSTLARSPDFWALTVCLDLTWRFLKRALCRTTQRSLHTDKHNFPSRSSVTKMIVKK